jgi:hypothetical protein
MSANTACRDALFKEGSDVTFLVGPEKIPIKAHKTALAFNSEVFHAMFYGGLTAEDNISIDDITPGIFQQLVNSVHGKNVNLNTSNVTQILYKTTLCCIYGKQT